MIYRLQYFLILNLFIFKIFSNNHLPHMLVSNNISVDPIALFLENEYKLKLDRKINSKMTLGYNIGLIYDDDNNFDIFWSFRSGINTSFYLNRMALQTGLFIMPMLEIIYDYKEQFPPAYEKISYYYLKTYLSLGYQWFSNSNVNLSINLGLTKEIPISDVKLEIQTSDGQKIDYKINEKDQLDIFFQLNIGFGF